MSTTATPPVLQPIVDEPVPQPVRWGDAELAQLAAMVRQKSLFYWNGPQTNTLLADFRQHYPLKHLFPCSSGSASLHIAVAALRLKPGEEIIVSPITDMGSVIGILYQQGVPVFCDLDPRTYNMDPAAIRRAITPKTRAIMAVHLAGNPCDMTAILAIAKEHNLVVIEDCAQSWGAQHRGKPVGLMGDFGCYSFNDFKHIACGDGGMVGTNRDDLGAGLSKWGDKCYDRVAGTRDPEELAPNYRMSEPESAVCVAQLGKLENIVARRNRAGTLLTSLLQDLPGVLPPVTREGDFHSYWFYFLRLDLAALKVSRADFVAELKGQGVAANAGYIPMPVYRYKVFQNHNFFGGAWPVRDFGLTTMDYTKVDCPVAQAILDDGVTLPLNQAMSDAYIEKVARAIRFVAGRLAK
ncbi:MAG TPA: DegT/DnrJ/EryC1/StrS family aminotransferase [Opitutaceae bacterium]|nr:DegT/DnrJ/EryC1/StrS family aminotransferase [Opitutaceae bacterium]HRJ46802.1 DegT/DnrJ/EryC1/StrS family aminotransferase [Opitutaceae bacterium]